MLDLFTRLLHGSTGTVQRGGQQQSLLLIVTQLQFFELQFIRNTARFAERHATFRNWFIIILFPYFLP